MRKTIGMAVAVLAIAGSVHAQQGKASQPLEYRTMELAVFNSQHYQSTASRADVSLARIIWEKEISSIPNGDNGQKLPAFVIIASDSIDGKQVVFSSLSGFGVCPPAANGHSVVDIYGVCNLKITVFEGEKSTSHTVGNFCHLYGLDSNTPVERNQVQYALDTKERVVHFRVIQHGKEVPECYKRIGIK